jgi:hypothetical protein
MFSATAVRFKKIFIVLLSLFNAKYFETLKVTKA